MTSPFRFPKPRWLANTSSRTAGVYTSGSLVSSSLLPLPSSPVPPPSPTANIFPQFSLALYIQISTALFSRSPQNYTDPAIHITLLSWLPLICSALGMLTINLLDKASIAPSDGSSSGGGFAGGGDAGRQWMARFVLFLGFALIAGGLAGSVTILVLEFGVKGVGWPASWMGVGGVLANGLVMAR